MRPVFASSIIISIAVANEQLMNASVANDNCAMQKAGMDWNYTGLQLQYNALAWYDKLDCCDEMRLAAWQGLSGKTIPAFREAYFEGLLRTQDEIERAKRIEQQLINEGRA